VTGTNINWHREAERHGRVAHALEVCQRYPQLRPRAAGGIDTAAVAKLARQGQHDVLDVWPVLLADGLPAVGEQVVDVIEARLYERPWEGRWEGRPEPDQGSLAAV
jgi:hypothetical protein